MNFLSNNPFIKIFFLWVLGILTAQYLSFFNWVLLAALLPFSVWFLKLRKKRRYPIDLVGTLTLALTLILFSHINYNLLNKEHPDAPADDIFIKAQILHFPEEKKNSYQALLRVECSEHSELCRQKIIAWTQKSDLVAKLKPGDVIYCQGRIALIENRGNPFEFDYKRYLAQQGIHYSCYLKSSNIFPVDGAKSSLKLRAEIFRGKLLQLLRTQLKVPESFEVISALTLGYRQELSQETVTAFTKTGAMHVLAVSGLHVGLLFLFLMSIFRFLNRVKYGKWIQLTVIAAILWIYALLTGLSPSVLRATTMFTFLLIAETLNRKHSIYNSIAASAFFLLLFSPNILFSVGFQLSYAAVLSIVYFYPKLNALLNVNNKLLLKIWQLFCVSAAAQIGTFPLSIYYFNQFPIFFWLSNFVVIPAAFLLFCGTILFFITSPASWVQTGIATVLEQTTILVLKLLRMIADIPSSVITHISISSLQLALLFLILLLIIFFIEMRRAKMLISGLVFLLIFNLLSVFEKAQNRNQHKYIIYNHSKPTIHFINGRNNYILASDTATLSPYIYDNVVTKLHLNSPVIIPLSGQNTFYSRDLILMNDICQFGKQTFRLPTTSKDKKMKLIGQTKRNLGTN